MHDNSETSLRRSRRVSSYMQAIGRKPVVKLEVFNRRCSMIKLHYIQQFKNKNSALIIEETLKKVNKENKK